ncbi:MAG: hypothetical protein WC455_19395 [Dehalococcoidia bacterium]|jgi:hypothetical protein
MDELLKAIVALYAAAGGATLRTATPGGMWLDEAPQNASGTFVVLTGVSAQEDFVMNSTVGTIDALVQFNVGNIASGTDSLVVTAGQAVRSTYHNVILTGMTGITCLMAKCNNARLIRDPDSTGYSYVIETRYLLGR